MKRRKLLIFPKFQLRLVAVNLILLLLFALSIFWIIDYSFTVLSQYGATANLESGHPFYELLNLQKMVVIKYFAIVLLSFLLISTFVYLLFSHQLVGPILRLKSYFVDYKKGETLEFRKGDYLKELGPHINRFVRQRDD